MDTTVFLEEKDYDLWNDLPSIHPTGREKTVEGLHSTTWFKVSYTIGGIRFDFSWAKHDSFEWTTNSPTKYGHEPEPPEPRFGGGLGYPLYTFLS